MTLDELQRKFTRATRIVNAERHMREHVFRAHPDKQAHKMAEMDELIAILVELKDALKPHCEGEAMEQPRLLDAPQRPQYG